MDRFDRSRQVQLTANEVNHHDEVLIVSIPTRPALDHLKHIIDPFHVGIGDSVLPVFQDSGEVPFNAFRHLDPDRQQIVVGMFCLLPNPGQKSASRTLDTGESMDVLQA